MFKRIKRIAKFSITLMLCMALIVPAFFTDSTLALEEPGVPAGFAEGKYAPEELIARIINDVRISKELKNIDHPSYAGHADFGVKAGSRTNRGSGSGTPSRLTSSSSQPQQPPIVAIPDNPGAGGGGGSGKPELDPELGFLIPNYGSNGKFIAPIGPPIANSIPISNRAELEAIADDLSGNYHLTANIDLSGAAWTPLGDNSTETDASRFTGTFDGQGYVIRNLTINGEGYKFNGLFGYIRNATIINVGFEGTSMNIIYTGNAYYTVNAGGLCGLADVSDIGNCYNTGNINVSANFVYAGGICGEAYPAAFSGDSPTPFRIINSYNTGSITASGSYYVCAGGIYGLTEGPSKISSCFNTGAITASSENASSHVGGIVGFSTATVYGCANSGAIRAISSESDFASAHGGGICGVTLFSQMIYACYNTGSVSVNSARSTWIHAGGICGISYFTSSIEHCHNAGTITVSSAADDTVVAGGICGDATNSPISNSDNTGRINAISARGPAFSGGICGYADDSSISNCHNTMSVSASAYLSARAGGISGLSDSHEIATTINNCHNIGNIIASTPTHAYAGGISGGSNKPINNCFNEGTITASSNNTYITSVFSSEAQAGGISGYISGTSINNGYNVGTIIAEASDYAYSGGISGDTFTSTIDNCYSTGDISATSSDQVFGGGITSFSYSYSSIKNCYWSIDSNQKINGIERLNAYKLGIGGGSGIDNTVSLNSSAMKIAANFAGFDFVNVWGINPDTNNGFPFLRSITDVTSLTYTVSYNANGGAGTMAPGTATKGVDFTIAANSFNRANYTFSGWNTAANGSGAAYGAGATITNIQSNITLYAQWAPKTSGNPGPSYGGGGGGDATTTVTKPAAPLAPVNEDKNQSAKNEFNMQPFINPFTDVKANDWFYNNVGFVFQNNLMTGTSTEPMLFSPNTPVTRAMVVTVLWRLEGSSPADRMYANFTDVQRGSWYESAVAWAAQNGVARGYKEGSFRPNDKITRQDLTVILNNYTKFSGKQLPTVRNYTGFNDEAEMAVYAKETIESFYRAGIINGRPGNNFAPRGPATRAEFAAILNNFLINNK